MQKTKCGEGCEFESGLQNNGNCLLVFFPSVNDYAGYGSRNEFGERGCKSGSRFFGLMVFPYLRLKLLNLCKFLGFCCMNECEK